jgi:tRNA U34 5-methylaminomethyl-2-thiouridine-forming methyltransferase MnmC
MSAIIHRDARAHARADFGKIQTDAIGAPKAVIFFDHHVVDEHAGGARVIQNDSRNGILRDFANKRGAHAQAGARVRDVEFAAAHIHFQTLRELDAAVSRRREADHTFAERDNINFAFRGIAQLYRHTCLVMRLIMRNPRVAATKKLSTSGYQLVRLANGVHSIRSNAENETFHPVVGPVEEARQLYVEQLRLPERIAAARREFVIWDVGLGAAANVLTLLEACATHTANVQIVSFDHTLEPIEFAVEHARELAYPLPYVAELACLRAQKHIRFSRSGFIVDWRVHVADFPTHVHSPAAEEWPKPDAILFDAFSPAKNPAMWTLPLFCRMFELLDPKRACAMPTYSRSTMLRVTLLLGGFFVGAGRAIAEKEETTIAANELSLVERPLGRDWLKRARNSTCAEPLLEPFYTRAPLSETSLRKLEAHPQFNT